ncbi:MAG TPA: hypothetical protein PLB89_04670 [Flavobacteriales bacterium]|nr:hypothetical protein [Flavobacteriales bacterium]
MTHREQITALFLDAAKRHPDILHTDTVKPPRFYELEWEEMVQSGSKLAAVHWTLILEEYVEEFRDNGADYISLFPHIAFLVGKHVPQGNNAAKQATYLEARRIAHSIVGKFRSDERDRCNADLPPGVNAPALVELSTLRIQPIKLPLLDNAYGVRCTIKIRTDQEEHFSRDEVAWLPLP